MTDAELAEIRSYEPEPDKPFISMVELREIKGKLLAEVDRLRAELDELDNAK